MSSWRLTRMAVRAWVGLAAAWTDQARISEDAQDGSLCGPIGVAGGAGRLNLLQNLHGGELIKRRCEPSRLLPPDCNGGFASEGALVAGQWRSRGPFAALDCVANGDSA